jgi:hypothetical protein
MIFDDGWPTMGIAAPFCGRCLSDLDGDGEDGWSCPECVVSWTSGRDGEPAGGPTGGPCAACRLGDGHDGPHLEEGAPE